MAKQSAARAETVIAAAKPKESGLGHLSDEDRAAIMGAEPRLDPVAAPETVTMMDQPTVSGATPAEVELGGRLATVEGRMAKVEAAMEKWAAMMNDRPTMMAHLAANAPAVVRPATREEEAAYCRWNFECSGSGELPFDGIQAWRDAGRPGLKP